MALNLPLLHWALLSFYLECCNPWPKAQYKRGLLSLLLLVDFFSLFTLPSPPPVLNTGVWEPFPHV